MPRQIPRLILASSSVYRSALLARLRLPFDVLAPDIDESALPGELPGATALRLASAKAQAPISAAAPSQRVARRIKGMAVNCIEVSRWWNKQGPTVVRPRAAFI